MRGIVILSPHRDDAVFSLCLSMAKWARRGIKVRVVNFFTQSAYAPRAAAPEHEPERSSAVSLLREREDRSAILAVHPAIETTSFGFLDAPLRLGIEVKDVFAARDDRIEYLSKEISEYLRHGPVLSPLGLGDHVDHLAIRGAAIAACDGHGNLGFYEDLPYRVWTKEEILAEHVKQTGIWLRPVTIRAERAIWNKRRIASRYRSQITPSEADCIARFASQYRGGERIWIPRYGGRDWAIYSTRQRASAKGQSRSTHT